MHEKQLDEFIRIAKKLLSREKYTIVEIGARDCKETVAFDLLLPGSKIFTFECNPETLPQCRRAVAGRKNIQLIEKAVTDAEGTITFHQINHEKTITNHPGGKNPGASSIFEANQEYPVEKYFQNKIIVPTTTLKKFSEENKVKNIDLLWMDIQGAELLAMMGAGDFLEKVSLIHLETEFFQIYKNQPLFPELRSFLNERGFRLYTFTAMGQFSGDAVFLNTNIIEERGWLFPEMLIYYFYRGKVEIKGKIRFGFTKLKMLLKKSPVLRRIAIHIYILGRNTKALFCEQDLKKEYYSLIEKIKKNKKIVLDIQFGGLGDWLVLTTLPRLLKETYNVDFFLSRQSLSLLRNHDTYKMCFEMNPYFKGVSDDTEVFRLKTFSSEMNLWNFFTDLNGENIIELLERQFQCKGVGVPEIYYKPKLLKQYENIILVDKNYISGIKLGWHYNGNSFESEIQKELTRNPKSNKVEYVDPTKQDLFMYADMIYSCAHFITVLSGGAALATCFKKPFTALLPYDVFGGSVEQFVFRRSKGVYVK